MTAERGAPGAFFRSMVLVGSSLAMGCGGMADDNAASGAAGDSAGGTGAGGTATGASPGVGGTSSGATHSGPAPGSGGTSAPQPGGGGTGGTLSPVTPGPFDCPPPQWVCGDPTIECGPSYEDYTLPVGCGCDESRPLTVGDCPDEAPFTCHVAASDAEGRPFTERVLFACECIPAEDHCSDACRSLDAQPDFPYCDTEPVVDLKQVVCGCELPILR